MKCRTVRKKIALWVGKDLNQAEDAQVREHLDHCPECHQHAQRMLASSNALADFNDDSVCTRKASLWPKVQHELASEPASPRRRQQGSLPVLAVAAVAIVLSLNAIIFSQPQTVAVDSIEVPASVVSDGGRRPSMQSSQPPHIFQGPYVPFYQDESWQALGTFHQFPKTNVRNMTGF